MEGKGVKEKGIDFSINLAPEKILLQTEGSRAIGSRPEESGEKVKGEKRKTETRQGKERTEMAGRNTLKKDTKAPAKTPLLFFFSFSPFLVFKRVVVRFGVATFA